jgi:hypothetical protein
MMEKTDPTLLPKSSPMTDSFMNSRPFDQNQTYPFLQLSLQRHCMLTSLLSNITGTRLRSIGPLSIRPTKQTTPATTSSRCSSSLTTKPIMCIGWSAPTMVSTTRLKFNGQPLNTRASLLRERTKHDIYDFTNPSFNLQSLQRGRSPK